MGDSRGLLVCDDQLNMRSNVNSVDPEGAMKERKGSIDNHETFDEFLAEQELLEETEDAAVREIIADQAKTAFFEE
jgi:hypothetical protein